MDDASDTVCTVRGGAGGAGQDTDGHADSVGHGAREPAAVAG
jgi:hypothetical protein